MADSIEIGDEVYTYGFVKDKLNPLSGNGNRPPCQRSHRAMMAVYYCLPAAPLSWAFVFGPERHERR